MKQINEVSFIKDGVAIEPGERVFFVSRCHNRTKCLTGTYIGTDFFGYPVVRYESKRFFYKTKSDCGWVPTVVTVSLPLKRIFSKNHLS
jgi:hypothetical protein